MIVTDIIQLCFEGLHEDGGGHKQWYLEQILKRITSPQMFEDLKHDEKYGEWEEASIP